MDAEVLWEPAADVRTSTRIGAYLAWLERTRGLRFDDYEQLWRWSVEDLDAFWASVWEFFEVIAHHPYSRVLSSHEMPGTVWFEGALLNYAEHCLRTSGDGAALISHSQSRPPLTLSFDELRLEVARVRAGLQRLGVQRGDRVAAYLPNIAETVVALLACASLGAVWSSCAPEFGRRSVVDRFAQIEPVVLLAVDGYRYGSKDIDRRDDLAAIRAELPSLRHTVLLPYLDSAAQLPDALTWDSLRGEAGPLEVEPGPVDHPLHILYSSRTAALPNPSLHAHTA